METIGGSNVGVAIRVNGESRHLCAATSISAFLASLDLSPRQVAVELNRVIVKRDRFDDVVLNDGDEVEIVHFVGGG